MKNFEIKLEITKKNVFNFLHALFNQYDNKK